MAITTGRDMPADLMFDICIIGAGAAGLTVASNFLTGKLSVAVLESGGTDRRPSASENGAASPLGLDYAPLSTSRLRGFGGSTQAMGWGGLCKPLDSQDFEVRPWVRDSGWPFGIEELAPYYERAGTTLGLSDIKALADRQYLFPDRSALLSVDNVELCRHRRLGSWFRDPLERSSAVNVLTSVTVLYLEYAAGGTHISSAICADAGGKRFRISSSIFVLAAGGIENSRLLLLSNRLASRGSGLIGSYFMDHPRFTIGTLKPADGQARSALAGLDRIRIARQQRMAQWLGVDRNRRYLVKGLTLPFQVQQRAGLLNYRAWIEPCYPGQNAKTINKLKQMLLDHRDRVIEHGKEFDVRLLLMKNLNWTNGMHIVRPRRLAMSFRLHHFVEPEPHRESAITLSSEEGRFGLPLASVSWRLSSNTLNSLTNTIGILQQEFQNSGLAKLEIRPEEWENIEKPMWTWHHMGTTRMHHDTCRGVVDENCRVHGVRNLFVSGSSVFPTVGNDTPTLTVIALAHRLSDYLRRPMS